MRSPVRKGGQIVTNDKSYIVEPIIRGGENKNWIPIVGPETIDFLNYGVPEESRDCVCDAAISILSKGIPPDAEKGNETGLVIGYVQSGKTMSFETVAALARDNNYQIVIILAGTSTTLLGQTTERLRKDLRLEDHDRIRRWVQYTNPCASDTTIHSIRDVLDGWRDYETPEEYKRTVLITVLKHYSRLENLTKLIGCINVQGIPTLIIDDEADQASLNNEAPQGEQSRTYGCLIELRQAIPSHTYLQYTATPQAPLLINIVDTLSPNFIQLLEPGKDYVGGMELFGSKDRHIRLIPVQDIPTYNENSLDPPESLLNALRIFMIGVAAGIISGDRGNRSMMVHPSRETAQHVMYFYWVRNIFEEWKRILNLENSDQDRQDLMEDFHIAYKDLCRTVVPEMPTFENIQGRLGVAFRNTRILEVNAREGGQTPIVDWRNSYGWILVGGQAMDRGFTINGLTVTYMPRGIGVGNADTLQQRARFFGYKRAYLGYCRIYLEQSVVDAFRNYIKHEEDIRRQLKDFQINKQPLNEWKRAFILDAALKPCRHSVLEFDYMRGRFSDNWFTPHIVLVEDTIIQGNRELVDRFTGEHIFVDDEGHPDRTSFMKHQVCHSIPLYKVVEELLVDMRIAGSFDSQRNTGLLIQLTRALERNHNEPCHVVKMRPAIKSVRGIGEHGEIKNLFQGKHPVYPTERRGEVYPGDRDIRISDQVTVQIHRIDLAYKEGIVKEDVPVLAVWVPARLAQDWIAQNMP